MGILPYTGQFFMYFSFVFKQVWHACMYLLTLFIRLWIKNFCLIVITVQYRPCCPANKESWYVLKIMGSYFSGISNRNKLPLSKSLSFRMSILNKKLLIMTKLSALALIQFCAFTLDGSFPSVMY